MYITNDGTTDEAIRDRNIQVRRAINLLNSVLWDKSIMKANKHRIYNSTIKSVVTYGSEVWQLKQRSENSLKVTEMDFWKRAAGKSRWERIRNERIQEIMNVRHTIVEDRGWDKKNQVLKKVIY